MKTAHLLIAFLLLFFEARPQKIITIAGSSGTGAYGGDNGRATAARLWRPWGVTTDRQGNVYFTDQYNGRVRKINTSGIITTFAGTGAIGFSGDGGPATAAVFNQPRGIAVDSSGNVYIGDIANHRIRMVDTHGTISTIAGTGGLGYSGDGGPATDAQFLTAYSIAIDDSQNLYFADWGLFYIRKINRAGIISTIAGRFAYGYSGDGGPATASGLFRPCAVAERNGCFYIAEDGTNRVRKVDTAGIISTIAGADTGYIDGHGWSTGDGGPATAAHLHTPTGIAVDVLGNVYVSETAGYVVRKIDTNGIITTIAGRADTYGSSGDGGPATAALLALPSGLHIDIYGSLYIADFYNNRIRKITNYVPFFTHGASCSFNLCSGAFSLDTLLTATDSNTLQTLAWRQLAPPAHGTVVLDTPLAATGSAVTPTGSSYTPAAGYVGLDSFSVRVTDGFTSDTIFFRMNVLPAGYSVTPVGPANLCPHDTALFTATPPGGNWLSSNRTVATISSGGAVSALAAGTTHIFYTFASSCHSDTIALPLTVLPAVHPSLAIHGSPDSICAGWPVTFAAAATFAGPSPAYRWHVNGTAIAMTTDTFRTSALSDTDHITCTLTADTACAAPAAITANAPRVRVFPAVFPGLSLAASPAYLCAGLPATLTATPLRGGSVPHYRWSAAGATIGTGNPLTYIPSGSSYISCVLTSNDPGVCPLQDTVTDTLHLFINPSVTPTVTITTTHSPRISYLGELVTWDAEVTYGGSNPTFQWFVNGEAIAGATTMSYTREMYTTNDTVTCIITSNHPCALRDSATSNASVALGAYLSVNQPVSSDHFTANVAPNPTSDAVQITFSGAVANDLAVRIMNVTGTTVLHTQATIKHNGNISVDVASLAPGVYMMEIVNGSNKLVQKLVKE